MTVGGVILVGPTGYEGVMTPGRIVRVNESAGLCFFLLTCILFMLWYLITKFQNINESFV
jgi:hypothetical protein